MEKLFTFCVTICICVLIGCLTFYHYSENASMEKNIESAIAKGIDPIAVKCAYADRASNLCLVYSMQQSQASKK